MTGGASDGVSIAGCSGEFNGIDITGFSSLTITSSDNDDFSDTVTIEIDVEATFVATTPPNCDAQLLETTDVPVAGDISWNPATGGAESYNVAVGTSPGGTDVLSVTNLGNVTMTNLGTLDFSTTYYVSIVPQNANGMATGCMEQTFTTVPPPPVGSVCEDPILITLESDCATATPTTVDFSAAEDLGTIFSCDTVGTNNGFWFDFTTGATGAVTFNVSGADNEYAVFDSCGGVELICGGINESATVSGFAPNTNLKIAIWRDSFETLDAADICFQEVSCLFPTALDFNVTSATTTDISWTAGNTPPETAWEYVLQAPGTGLPTAAGVPTTDNPLTLSGLIEGDSYELYLRAVCGMDSFSVWAGPITWTQVLAPANDDCMNATELTPSMDDTCNPVSASTIAATESEPGCIGTADDDIWFRFTALSENHNIMVTNTDGTTDIVTQVLDACGGTEIVCQDTPNSPIELTGLAVGTEYFFRVYSWSATTTTRSSFDICVVTPAPPPPASTNTSCATAETISCGQTLAGNSVNSMGTSEDSGCTMGVNGLWYVFTGTGFDVTLTATADFDHRMAIASGSCGTLTNIVCDDQSTGPETHTFMTTAGETYYVYIAHWQGGNTTTGVIGLTLECAGPPNDECMDATPVTFGTEVMDNNSGATDSMVTTSTCFTGSIRDVWYSVEADAVGELFVNDLTAGFQYAIYSDCMGTELSCNAEATGLTEGTTYYIRINDDGTDVTRVAGGFSFTPASAVLSTNDFDSETGFTYYPNPVKNTLTLNAQQNIDTVTMYNMLGQEVLRLSPNSVNATVDMSNLNTGAYFAQVSILGNTQTVRIIKQ